LRYVDHYIAELGMEVRAPEGWSHNAIRIFADKYLHADDHGDIQCAINRVANGVSNDDDALAARLVDGIYHQRYSFNSPVWFNVGIEPQPQCHACFIQSVNDDMDSILELATKEGQLFKYGSGTGTNLSAIRGSGEGLTGGGHASGPVSFMRVYDAVAGTVKSGGKTRRAAKMQILDADHPDIAQFVLCKAREESKAKDLIEKAGYDSSFDGEAYGSVFFQNSNLSVRVTDEFMQKVNDGHEWELTARTTGNTVDRMMAGTLLRMIARAAWECGDPGIQFHDTINAWNTCPHEGTITASNPCSEYMFLNETACNLSSLNLLAYEDEGEFNIEQFVLDVNDLVVAMDNIIDLASYPTPMIELQSKRYRTLGLGFTNLGGLLMARGLDYDTHEARDLAASITALMHFAASNQSAMLARNRGTYDGYDASSHLSVHMKHGEQHTTPVGRSDIWDMAWIMYTRSIQLARDFGFRNAQMTVLAPTGTISFIMDCVTTGIEPLFARSMTKALAGGSTMELKYDHVGKIASEIAPVDHVKMMAACQPFLSGAISKTVNMPNDATTGEIEDIYMEAWQRGLKAIAVYRDGCKASQPLVANDTPATAEAVKPVANRHALPATRNAVNHKFSVAGHDCYLTVGLYDDGSPGEVFLHSSKEGSTISGALDAWAIAVSIALQHGVPLDTLMDKHAFTRFEPSGLTSNSEIPMAHSIIDYVARWMLQRHDTQEALKPHETKYEWTNYSPLSEDRQKELIEVLHATADADSACPDCGGMMIRTGTCQSCPTCGYNGGCG